MFEKLVLSAKERRKGRTSRFFLLTTMFYAFGVVSALVVSVVAANPLMFERVEVIKLVPPLPPPPSPPSVARSVAANRQPQVIPRPSILNPVAFTELNKTSTNRPPVIPTSTVSSDVTGPVGAYGPGVGTGPGVIGAWSIDSNQSSIAPPAPPPAPKPKPEPQQVKEPENKIVRLASSILTGKAITRKTPDYPALARQIRVEGSIVVEIVISPEGRVESARALGGHPLLTKSAVDAAYGWRFEPTILNGTAVRVTGVITFNFRIN